METEDEDDDTDSQGVGLVARRGTRFVSDSLHFTGTDLGDRSGSTHRRAYQQESEDDDDDSSDSDEDDEDEYELALLGPEEKEEALVQSAMARIQRAQEKGRTDVSLTKGELAALERRKQRMQEEAERRERKKRKEQRIAIPLTHLEPVSRKKRSQPPPEVVSSRHPSAASEMGEAADRQVYPPMGYFPPPAGSRTRPRSGTSHSHRPSSRARDERGSSPFQYEYVRPGSATGRHVSDSVARPRSSRGMPQDEYSRPSSRNAPDPFLFQTAGPRAPQSGGAAPASRRYVSGPSDPLYMTRRDSGSPAAARSTRASSRRSVYEGASDETSELSSDLSTSDDLNSGASIREPARTTRSQAAAAAAQREVSPEPAIKKKSSSEAAPKRKPVPSRGGRRKKK